MLVTRASPSAVERSSGGDTSAVLIVNGMTAPFCVQLPIDTYAVARLFAGSFRTPSALPAFKLLSGHSDIRPCTDPAVGESLTRSGLSQTSVSMLLWKNDPS